MTETIGLRQGTLRLAESDPGWPAAFAEEAGRIARALSGLDHRIEHIGSTSVPGLAAKPILDIAMCAASVDHAEIAARLVGLGYIDRGERDGRLFIRLRDGDIRTHNLHLHRDGDAAWTRHVAFRDRLRADADLRAAYAALKAEIVRRSGGRRAGYAEAKGPFVEAALSVTPPGDVPS